MEYKLKEPMAVSIPTFATFKQEDSSVKVNNPSFYPCSVRIMAIDTIANRMKFSEDTTINALPSLPNVPLVALYKEDIDDFGDHEMYKDEEGRLRYRTYPIGTIPESANQWIEKVTDEEGIERLYLCSDALLWKRQHKEFSKIKEMEQMSVSMEVQITNGKFSEDRILEVGDFFFTAVTVLGENVKPAFHDAMISTFTEEVEYQEMMSELKEYMRQQFEGGNSMPNANFTPDGNEPENQQAQQPDGGQTSEPQEPVNNEPVEPKEDYKAMYEKAMRDAEALEAEYGKTIAEITGEKTNLEQQLQQLQADTESKIQSMTTELEELRQYKAEVVKVQKDAFRQKIIEDFGDLQDNDEFKELLTKIDDLEPEQVEMKCYAIVGRQARANKKPSKTQASSRIPVTTPTPDKPKNDGYNGLLLKRK